MFESKPRVEATSPPKVWICGDLALVLSKWSMEVTGPDGTQHRQQGTATDVMRRQDDGTWRYVIDNPAGIEDTSSLAAKRRSVGVHLSRRTQQGWYRVALITGGTDTHKDLHVAGRPRRRGPTPRHPLVPDDRGWVPGPPRLAPQLRRRDRVGVEGTGSWGAGLTRYLLSEGVKVLEVNRPNRQDRRRRGKSDPADAEAAARAVLAEQAIGIPKLSTGVIEAIRLLRLARRGAVKARTQAANQIHSVIDTAPQELRTQLLGLSKTACLTRCARLRPGDVATAVGAAKLALVSLARRWAALNDEIDALGVELARLLELAAPNLLAVKGVGTDVAGALLTAAGDNSERLGSEAAFAALCGASPVDASSGRQQRHRLNQGGDRHANSALFAVVMNRLTWDERTRAY